MGLCALILAGVVGPIHPASSDARPASSDAPPASSVPGAEQDVAAVLQQIKELFDARDSKQLVTPIPGSRSNMLAAEASTLYLYLEQGSVRGDAIDTFYEQYESGDMEAAYRTFTQNNVSTMRVSDYGWNGLGTPMATAAGAEINDVYFRVIDGVFQQAEITVEDRARYLETLQDVILPALRGS